MRDFRTDFLGSDLEGDRADVGAAKGHLGVPDLAISRHDLLAIRTVLESIGPREKREGIVDFGRRLRGFVTAEATLVGIESRTSAPVRILRDTNCESLTIKGLYPAGEGAGYAGGIMSSAVDGIKVADIVAGRLAG